MYIHLRILPGKMSQPFGQAVCGKGRGGGWRMILTAVCVVRPPKVDLETLSEGIGVLARAKRSVFARVFQCGEKEADVNRDVVEREGILARHYSGCRADAQAAAHGWKDGLPDARERLRNRLAQLEARPERDWRRQVARCRNAVATRKAETRLARVEGELQGRPRHCSGGPGSVAERPAWRVAQAPGRQCSLC